MPKLRINEMKFEIIRKLMINRINKETISKLVGLKDEELDAYMEEVKYSLTEEKIKTLTEYFNEGYLRQTPYDKVVTNSYQKKYR